MTYVIINFKLLNEQLGINEICSKLELKCDQLQQQLSGLSEERIKECISSKIDSKFTQLSLFEERLSSQFKLLSNTVNSFTQTYSGIINTLSTKCDTINNHQTEINTRNETILEKLNNLTKLQECVVQEHTANSRVVASINDILGNNSK